MHGTVFYAYCTRKIKNNPIHLFVQSYRPPGSMHLFTYYATNLFVHGQKKLMLIILKDAQLKNNICIFDARYGQRKKCIVFRPSATPKISAPPILFVRMRIPGTFFEKNICSEKQLRNCSPPPPPLFCVSGPQEHFFKNIPLYDNILSVMIAYKWISLQKFYLMNINTFLCCNAPRASGLIV